MAETEYVILRRRTGDFKPEFYTGGGSWSLNEESAEHYDGRMASILCENFTTKIGALYVEIVFRQAR